MPVVKLSCLFANSVSLPSFIEQKQKQNKKLTEPGFGKLWLIVILGLIKANMIDSLQLFLCYSSFLEDLYWVLPLGCQATEAICFSSEIGDFLGRKTNNTLAISVQSLCVSND